MNDLALADVFNLVRVETVISFLLIFFRTTGIFVLAPILSNRAVPAPFQIALAFILSFLVFPHVPFGDAKALVSDLYLIQLIIREVTIGLVIGFVAMATIVAVQAAGEIVGMKIGFSIASVIDPNSQSSASVISQFYMIIAMLIFLTLDGHHVVLESLVHSFRILPIGTPLAESFAGNVPNMIGELMVVAIKIAAPVIIVITLLNLIFGLLTKISPQLNIFFNVGFIVGPALGAAAIIASLPLMRIIITQLTEGLRPELLQMIQQMKGTY